MHTTATSLDSDPLAVFERVVDSYENCFLLETLGEQEPVQASRQSYIGVAPEHHFSARGKKFYIDGKVVSTGDPYQALRQQIQIEPNGTQKYAGGLVGYTAHEALAAIEPSVNFSYQRDFCDFEYGLYRDGLSFEAGRAPEYFHYDDDRLSLYDRPATKALPLTVEFLGAQKTAPEYTQMVTSALEDISNGRVFQVVLANKYDYSFQGDLLQLYKELRRINPSPYMFFIKFGATITLGASPELLIHVTPRKSVYLEALAGTIRRGQTAVEDQTLAHQLLNDEKEIAEHNMLVDLARNDVGHISQIGSVKIDKLRYIKRLSHVLHICSLVSGRLAADRDAFDAWAATAPAGTLVGTPKIEAAKMIAALEAYERGPYGGTVGYFSYSGDSMHAVNIRSVSTAGQRLTMHSGSGIVYDSSTQQEYQEISDKKAAMDVAMAPFLRRKTA
jgi:anthranilate synthase component I